ncbi:MAG: sugar lactone lactonase YvrE [Flavobacteriales bacterium]|jgi:sugar lactone lactonase YvrE
MSQVEIAFKIQAKLGECPRWNVEEQCLYWIDINSMQLHRLDYESGEHDFLQFDEEIGCFSFREDEGFVVAMKSGFHFLESWNAALTPICDPEADLDKSRFNDGRCDAHGRFLAGSYYPPKDYDGANLWSLDVNLKASKLADDLLTSNGTAFSPDNKTLYYSDTPKHIIYACDYDIDSGEASNRRTFCEFPFGNGRPDGASVDIDGYYWSALYEGSRIVRIDPQGNIVQEIAVPAKCPTMVAFGGDDMRTLFITTVGARPEDELEQYPNSGSIFKVRVETPGLAEFKFKG